MRGVDVALDNGVAEEGVLDRAGLPLSLLSNILHKKLSSTWNALLSYEESRELGTAEEGRVLRGGWEERRTRISCKAQVRCVSSRCLE